MLVSLLVRLPPWARWLLLAAVAAFSVAMLACWILAILVLLQMVGDLARLHVARLP